MPFAANYEIETGQELPGAGGEVVTFARGQTGSVSKGLSGPLLRIEPRKGLAWLACFGDGYSSGEAVNAILTTPDPDAACVIVDGAGYWINTRARTGSDIRVFPIRQVEVVGELLLFADFTRLAAYGASGPVWISQRLVSDRLRILRADFDAKLVYCMGFKADSVKDVEVKVDLTTGRTVLP
jgi:hypothetical protein